MLSYESTGKIGVSAARIIFRECIAVERNWWIGALGIEPSEIERPTELRGETALFGRAGASDDEDLFMAFADAVFILEHLGQWWSRFKIKRHLRMNGDDWGAIDPSGRTGALVSQMDKWAGRAKVAWSSRGKWVVDEDRRADILSRFTPAT